MLRKRLNAPIIYCIIGTAFWNYNQYLYNFKSNYAIRQMVYKLGALRGHTFLNRNIVYRNLINSFSEGDILPASRAGVIKAPAYYCRFYEILDFKTWKLIISPEYIFAAKPEVSTQRRWNTIEQQPAYDLNSCADDRFEFAAKQYYA